ncbi:hypothetical protein [Cohnella laeviribosi]|uniref:hypothetical protein n=1 Tax=Cohnella laeviribosi TaxID=380174 RepID=UPI003D1D9834
MAVQFTLLPESGMNAALSAAQHGVAARARWPACPATISDGQPGERAERRTEQFHTLGQAFVGMRKAQ